MEWILKDNYNYFCCRLKPQSVLQSWNVALPDRSAARQNGRIAKLFTRFANWSHNDGNFLWLKTNNSVFRLMRKWLMRSSIISKLIRCQTSRNNFTKWTSAILLHLLLICYIMNSNYLFLEVPKLPQKCWVVSLPVRISNSIKGHAVIKAKLWSSPSPGHSHSSDPSSSPGPFPNSNANKRKF